MGVERPKRLILRAQLCDSKEENSSSLLHTINSGQRLFIQTFATRMIPLPPAECVTRFLQESQRLGIDVRWTNEGMTNLDAAYLALPGAPGVIKLRNNPQHPRPQQLCKLLAHEMVHVLQHWKGDLRATPPLGWPKGGAPEGRRLSPQEAEAYTAQSTPAKVLEAVSELKPVNP